MKDLPQVALLQGPTSIGKFYGCTTIASHLTNFEDNLLIFESLFIEDVERYIEWTKTIKDGKYFCIIAAEKSSKAAWSRLLNSLEHPSKNLYTWIIDYGYIPASIHNRTFHYQFKPLSDKEIEKIGKPELSFTISPVVTWLESVEKGSREELYSCATSWKSEHTQVLLKELHLQLQGESSFDKVLTNTNKDTLLDCINLCSLNGPDMLKSISSGLLLLRNF